MSVFKTAQILLDLTYAIVKQDIDSVKMDTTVVVSIRFCQ